MNSSVTALKKRRNFKITLIKSLINRSLLLSIILMIVLNDIRPS
jgi:hypothetical protein